MTTHTKETTYTLVRVVKYVTFNCPYCECEHRIDYDTFEANFGEEYDVWVASNCTTWECEECGKEFEFNGVDYD